MSNYEEFLEALRKSNVKFDIAADNNGKLQGADVLFHTPIISLAIVVIAHSLKEGFSSTEVSTWTGNVLAQTFLGTKQANRKLEWSLVLRKRCADALIFLEAMDLIIVAGKDRKISLTNKGKDFCKKSLKREDSYGQLVRGLKRTTTDTHLKGFSLL